MWRGVPVPTGEVIDGFPANIELLTVRARTEDGRVRSPDEVQQECARKVTAAVAEGRRVLLHLMDQSKTGLVSLADVERLGAAPERLGRLRGGRPARPGPGPR